MKPYEDTDEDFDADHTNPRAGYVQHAYSDSSPAEAYADPETYDERDTYSNSLPDWLTSLIANSGFESHPANSPFNNNDRLERPE